MSNTTTNLRDQIAQAIVERLQSLTDPNISLVTREPFEPDRIAITDFPAVLVQMDLEERETITMGMLDTGRRMGTITFGLRGYVRGVSLDSQRNTLISGIETALDADRYLGLREAGVTDSQLIRIEIIKRLPPLAEIHMEFAVKYNYVRGAA